MSVLQGLNRLFISLHCLVRLIPKHMVERVMVWALPSSWREWMEIMYGYAVVKNVLVDDTNILLAWVTSPLLTVLCSLLLMTFKQFRGLIEHCQQVDI